VIDTEEAEEEPELAPSLIDPVQYGDTCSECGSPVDEYASNAQRLYCEEWGTPGVVCADCITVYEEIPELTDLFDRIYETLSWADQWKWETASFEDKFWYSIRVQRLVESAGWASVVSDPIRPKLPDTSPPQNADYQTALELVLETGGVGYDERTSRPVAIDLFSGAGGAALGMLDAGFSVIGFEYEDTARLTHTVNLDRVLNVDLSNVELPNALPKPDWVHASPPCQGFTRAGLQQKDDERNQLTWASVDWIVELSPTIVTLEQVPGFRDSDNHVRLKRELREAGYNTTMEIMNAADYGVPQSRERLIVIGVKEGANCSPSLPSPQYAEVPQMTLQGNTLEAYQTVGDVLPITRERALEQNHIKTSHTDRVRERFSRLKPGQNVSDLDNPGTKKACQRRLDPRKPAPTITGVPADYVHPTEDRCLTNRELARLQSFPDWFRFQGPVKGGGSTRGQITTQAEQIGNAVPPRLMKCIGEHVKKLIDQ